MNGATPDMARPTPTPPRTTRHRVLAAFGWAALAAVLSAGFAAYRRPDVAVDLANQLWHCF